ncbi:hypothetical protein [Lactococcus garvieae]|uniref:Uncharacterized protein n=1 Tax=Lactococcus garvieae TaxID=1363 RepID=A0AA46TVR2_9LACT|nr:hypothetical protein [Lactococcus garvieae]UYT10277.1 hypothetical protein OF801_10085 [Lactococcus garvieae]UYT12307.1 hypothetical protein OF800_10030 [Lactococcus garvieae]
MIIILKGNTHIARQEDCQVGGDIAFSEHFKHLMYDGCFKKITNGFALLNLIQAKLGIDLNSVLLTISADSNWC